MASVSCLVISRSPGLLNQLLLSLVSARRYWGPEDEVLCSWNGSEADEEAVAAPTGGPDFRIANRAAYHFATNMNQLASQAIGDVLILLNDDLVLDADSLDQALQILDSQRGVGLVGGRLRQPDGRLGHAGILFSERNLPYNRLRPERLGHLLSPDRLEILTSGVMPAVTGALMVIRRHDFLAVRFREDFRVCGEDVALCLDLRRQLALATYYAADVTAVHAEKSTRGEVLDHFDQQKLAALVGDLCREDPELRASLAVWATQEADVLESLLHQVLQSQDRFNLETNLARSELKQLEEHWQQQHSQALDWRERLDQLNEQLRRLSLSSPNQLPAQGHDPGELVSEIERLRLERDELRRERNHIYKELSRLSAEREHSGPEDNNLEPTPVGSSLRARIGLVAETERLIKERDSLSSELKRQVIENEDLSAELRQLLDQKDSLGAERDDLVAAQEILVAERDGLASERNTLDMALDRALAERELARIREADLRSSTCWKLTAPYRVVGDWLARIRSRR
ncbi:MAG: glycosyltransferase [Synechococcaceae cyanobacterium ELA739]